MAAGRRDLEGALGNLLSFDLSEVGSPHWIVCLTGLWRLENRCALQVSEKRQQVRCCYHLDVASPGGLRPLRDRADQPLPFRGRLERRQKHARRRCNPAIELQLTDDDVMRQRLGIDRANCGEQAQSDGQIEMRAFLGKVSRRQVHRDTSVRHAQPAIHDRGVHAVLALLHDGFGQADDREARQAVAEMHFDAHQWRFHAVLRTAQDRWDRHPWPTG
jgi:hypothetical protein